MRVLVACEESQSVTIAFRNKGHEAYSCDILQCSGGHPEWHIKEDAFIVIPSFRFYTQDAQEHFVNDWDLIILHCPCTYTALSGNRWYFNSPLRLEGIEFTKSMYELSLSVCNKVVLEQPKTIMQKYIGKRSQIIQPWQFGHGETKETWLWVNGLALLNHTDIVNGRENNIWKMPPSPDRSKLRSKTYQGIANAMAEQWNF